MESVLVLVAFDFDGVGVMKKLGGLCHGAKHTPDPGVVEAEGSEEAGAVVGTGVASCH